jgi:oligopeptide transport system substrate-binding protein
MRTYKFRALAASALLLASTAFLSGCPGRGGGVGGAGKNILRYALQTPPTNLDPSRVEDGDTIDLLQQVFEGLVQWSEKNEVVPNIAEKWDLSPDGKVYTFHLRTDVKFHNGRKMTASDVEYSFTRSLLPDTKSTTAKSYMIDIVGAEAVLDGKAKKVEGIKVLDDKTIQITIDKSRPYFLGKLTYPTAYVVCKEAIEKNSNKFDETTMVGTGPFKLESYQSGSMVKLAAFADYHGGKPVLDGIERPVKADSFTRQTAYESGDLDYTDVQRADVGRVKDDPKLGPEMKEFKRANVWYLAMNQNAFEPFKKKEVRQAFAYAINKDELIRLVYKGTAARATGIVPPGVPGYDSSYSGLPYDPKKAQALLAAAGYAGGRNFPKLTITYRQGYQYAADGVLAMRNDLKQNLGIEVDTQQMDWAKMLGDRNKGILPCYHIRWSADYLDPQDFLSLMLRTGAEENKIGYSNKEFDALCDQADVEVDPAKRLDLYRKAEKIVVEDAPWVCLFYLPDVELHKPYVKGIRDSLMGHLPHITTSVAR